LDKVSVLEFRRDAETIIRKVQRGKRLIFTYHGKPVMRLEPIQSGPPSADDPFYTLSEFAIDAGQALSNEEIDRIVYES
jgi:antitoxin (DNA-binding transcriptional repressor) of toxin-antitoxin stability system